MRHWERFLAYVRAHPGASTPEIAKAIGVNTGRASDVGWGLVPYGMVRADSGKLAHRSVTRWWPVEER